jgi:hypothetical protein
MSSKKFAVLALIFTTALGAGVAQARDRDEVHWSVTVGTPIGGPVISRPAPVVVQSVPVYPNERYEQHRQYRQPSRWDRDGDGIPNRYDGVYNPVWDRDGDGIPNRYDRASNPVWDRDGDGIPNRYDRYDNVRHDHDRDGVPDWQDRNNGRDRRDGWGR